MKTKARKILLVAASVAALALVVVLTPTGQAAAQGMMNALMVQVVNTPMVNAQQSGSWNVGINGGVNIANPATNPVLTRDVENPARQPFVEVFNCFGVGILCDAEGSVVPANKLLVIESVNVRVEVPAGQPASARVVVHTGNSTTPYFWVSLLPQPQVDAGRDTFVGTHALRFFAGPGSQVSVHMLRDVAINGPMGGEVFISGYLLDCGAGPGCPIP